MVFLSCLGFGLARLLSLLPPLKIKNKEATSVTISKSILDAALKDLFPIL